MKRLNLWCLLNVTPGKEARLALPVPAERPSFLGVDLGRYLLIHCSGPVQEAEVFGCSSNKEARIISPMGLQPPALIHMSVFRGHSA